MSRDTSEPSKRDDGLDRLFNAESVAIIGASTDPDKISGRPQHFLEKHDYEGKVYPVNPKYDTVQGATCYASVLDIPEEVDVALLLVPSKHIPNVLRECGEKGIRYNVVIGSGFSEIGDEGRDLEQNLLEIAAEFDIRIIGPNTLGIIGFDNNLTLCFSSMLDERDELVGDGEIAFVSQSGAFAGMLFLITQRMGIGTKYWASTGNEIDIDALELMEYMLDDPDVNMIIGYIESFTDGERFKAIAEKALERETPILIMKVGQSDRGQKAVSSHTGKMAGEYDVYAAVFREYGIVEVNEVTTLQDVMSAVSVLDALPKQNGEWGILSPSGGAGALIADAVDREGMSLAEFEGKTTDVLSEIVPEYGSVLNPVDTTANVISEYSLYEDAFSALLDDENVDILLLQFGNSGPRMAEAYEDLIKERAAETDKVIVSVFTGGKPSEEIVQSYRSAGIPTFTDPVRAVKIIGLLMQFSRALNASFGNRQGDSMLKDSADNRPDRTNYDFSNWDDASAVMDEYDIAHANGRVADSVDAAVSIGNEIGYPVVMKASSPTLEHKTEADGIRLGVDTAKAVERSFDDIYESVAAYDPTIELDGILVQESVEEGTEVIIGITETDLGPVMMFGLGGTFVEVMNDVSYRTLPVTRRKAADLIDETNAGKVFDGHRGTEYDTDALVSLMMNASRLYTDLNLTELDLNPVTVGPNGAVVVDFLAK